MFTYSWIFDVIGLREIGIEGTMIESSYLASKKQDQRTKHINVVELIRKAKFKEKKEKRQIVIIASAAVSALAAIGFVISLWFFFDKLI